MNPSSHKVLRVIVHDGCDMTFHVISGAADKALMTGSFKMAQEVGWRSPLTTATAPFLMSTGRIGQSHSPGVGGLAANRVDAAC